MMHLFPALTRSLAALALLWMGSMAWLPPGLAQDGGEYIPPDRGLPGRREGGGTRGNCPQGAVPLTALMPTTNFGLTTQLAPTLYWYIPPDSPAMAEFVLLDEDDNDVYVVTLTEVPSGGIIGLQLPLVSSDSASDPASDPASDATSLLTVGEDYRWYFSLICSPDNRASDIFTEGWIQRIDPPAALADDLATTPEGDRASLYATQGIWYDALSALLEPISEEPSIPHEDGTWATLLESVELEILVDQPLLPCCNPE